MYLGRMTPKTLLGLAGSGAALAAFALVPGGSAAAPAGPVSAAGNKAPSITGNRVGKVKIGARYTDLRKRKLVGKIGPGCELGGPNTRSARLSAGIKGSVDFTLKSPRRVTNITVRGGAVARGVGTGGTLADIKAVYPKAKEDHGTDETFGVTIVRVPKSDGGKIEFAVSTTTKRIETIGVPFIAFCE
jgi:hypothetical protein